MLRTRGMVSPERTDQFHPVRGGAQQVTRLCWALLSSADQACLFADALVQAADAIREHAYFTTAETRPTI